MGYMENNSIWDLFINQTEYGGWGKVVAPMELGKSKDEAIFPSSPCSRCLIQHLHIFLLWKIDNRYNTELHNTLSIK